ncbi:MAG: DUF642 domain-containing protein [Bryobacteraceae bacterium]|jgi:hypothetical protein
MKQTISIKLLAVAGLLMPCAFGATNLIVNGSFERPVVPVGGFTNFDTGTSSLGGWQVVGAPGNVSVVNTTYIGNGFTWPAAVGEQWLDLTGDGSNTATGVQQTVATTAGTTYSLTFYVGNPNDPGGPDGNTSTVNVFVNGAQTFAITNLAGAGLTYIFWQRYTTTFVAASSETTLAFMNGDGPTDNTNGLDGISLVAQAPPANQPDTQTGQNQ